VDVLRSRIERISEAPKALPEGALGYGIEGWQTNFVTPITIDCGQLPLWQVLYVLEYQHRGLLGDGDLVLLIQSEDPAHNRVTGYVLYLPEDVKEYTFGENVPILPDSPMWTALTRGLVTGTPEWFTMRRALGLQ
jgi:hypothetical protein